MVLEKVYKLIAEGDIDGAGDTMFEAIDSWCWESEWEKTDAFMRNMDLSRVPKEIMHLTLMLTNCVRQHLKDRAAFYDRVHAEYVRLDGETRADRLLAKFK